MELPEPGKRADKPVREQSKKVAKARYPVGRAIARIEYFERQRGLQKSTLEEGSISCAWADKPKLLKGRPRRGRNPNNDLYARAQQARMALLPSFQQSTRYPTWQSIGPNKIPHGQTYGTGGNNSPSVSGRCVSLYVGVNDPQHLVLCSASGGLWESTDQGGCWRPLTDQQSTLSMGACGKMP